MRFFKFIIYSCTLLAFSGSAFANDTRFVIVNKSDMELLSISMPNSGAITFSQLGLDVGEQDRVERPRKLTDVNLDMGLIQFKFPKVDLRNATRVEVLLEQGTNMAQKPVLQVEHTVAGIAQVDSIPGNIVDLRTDSTEKSMAFKMFQFPMGMPMVNVQALLKRSQAESDGGYSTSISFAGEVWPAKIFPNAEWDDNIHRPERERVGRVLLRNELDTSLFDASLEELERLNFVPYQAQSDKVEHTFVNTSPDQAKRELSIAFADAVHNEKKFWALFLDRNHMLTQPHLSPAPDTLMARVVKRARRMELEFSIATRY